jgi:hypothetical protein
MCLEFPDRGLHGILYAFFQLCVFTEEVLGYGQAGHCGRLQIFASFVPVSPNLRQAARALQCSLTRREVLRSQEKRFSPDSVNPYGGME